MNVEKCMQGVWLEEAMRTEEELLFKVDHIKSGPNPDGGQLELGNRTWMDENVCNWV